MIDYGFLCQAITDWRAGRRPQMPPSATPTLSGSAAGGTAPIELYPSGAPVEAAPEEDIDSDMMEVEEQYDAAADETAAEVDDLEAPAEPPPDYDSTMVYGTGGEMPGQSWSPAADDADPEQRDQ
jgi:hypothetical protein